MEQSQLLMIQNIALETVDDTMPFDNTIVSLSVPNTMLLQRF
jgi:hypothetical protein